ncbi:unnamed protein product [Rhizoctonia solani]|uniref:Unsaturated glucuronyl hydrolase n=1 Tax=Rhizoctonia solani TaxID=456999 RepID=A0A8H3GJ66_9AGAM|nr:unnamed protein product [Rhizoctonia solani]
MPISPSSTTFVLIVGKYYFALHDLMRWYIKGSSYQVIAYNQNTSAIIRRYTVQGYADNSTWAWGQAWGIYGFAKMFDFTTQPQYLDTAQRMAKVFLTCLSSNGVPSYDFDAPTSNRPADTSAATIAAEGLFILSEAEAYLLTDTFKLAFKPTWDSILSNGTSDVPQNNKNTDLVYGDYYAIQAGNT